MTISALAAGICIASGGIHAFSVALATPRCLRRSRPVAAPKDAPPVTIVQPLRGVGSYSRETLRLIFALDYPDYEIIFCLADADDPIAPLVRGAIAAHPERPAQLLIGDDRVSANPKLNNVVKGWKAAAHDWCAVRLTHESHPIGVIFKSSMIVIMLIHGSLLRTNLEI